MVLVGRHAAGSFRPPRPRRPAPARDVRTAGRCGRDDRPAAAASAPTAGPDSQGPLSRSSPPQHVWLHTHATSQRPTGDGRRGQPRPGSSTSPLRPPPPACPPVLHTAVARRGNRGGRKRRWVLGIGRTASTAATASRVVCTRSRPRSPPPPRWSPPRQPLPPLHRGGGEGGEGVNAPAAASVARRPAAAAMDAPAPKNRATLRGSTRGRCRRFWAPWRRCGCPAATGVGLDAQSGARERTPTPPPPRLGVARNPPHTPALSPPRAPPPPGDHQSTA